MYNPKNKGSDNFLNYRCSDDVSKFPISFDLPLTPSTKDRNYSNADLNLQLLNEFIDCFSKEEARITGNYKLEWTIQEQLENESPCLEIKYSIFERSMNIRYWLRILSFKMIKTHIIIALEYVFETPIDRNTEVMIIK